MRVAFVYPPQEVCPLFFTEAIYRQNTKEGAILPPLGIAYLAAIIEKRHVVTVIDANALRLGVDAVVDQLSHFRPDLLLYSLVTTNYQSNLAWIRAIKKHINVPVIVGGPQPSCYPHETMHSGGIDYCVIREGWETLPELLDCLENSGEVSTIKGIAYKHDGAIMLTEQRQGKSTFQGVPFPARHLLPNESYSTILSKYRPVTAMMSSMGCPYHCAYCAHDDTVVFRDPVDVVDEMEECHRKYGIREINFYDEIFTLDKERAAGICQELIRRDLHIAWSIRTRPDLVDPSLIGMLSRAGCIRINYGIETVNPAILRSHNRKGIAESQILAIVRSTKQAGINAFGFFMIGFPGEERQDIRHTIDFARYADFDYIQIAKVVPLPQTELYARVVEKSGRDFWRDYVLEKAHLDDSPQVTAFSAEELDGLLRKSYRSFYFRPGYLIRALTRVKSVKELVGLVHSALSL